MPDAARKWLERMAPYFDDDEAPWCHIARLLAENERLLESVQEKSDALYALSVHKGIIELLEADRAALVAYVRAKKGHIPAPDSVLPLKIVKAWQALGAELQEAIEDAG